MSNRIEWHVLDIHCKGLNENSHIREDWYGAYTVATGDDRATEHRPILSVTTYSLMGTRQRGASIPPTAM